MEKTDMTDLEFTLNTGAKIPALGLGKLETAPRFTPSLHVRSPLTFHARHMAIRPRRRHPCCRARPASRVPPRRRRMVLRQRRRSWAGPETRLRPGNQATRRLRDHQALVHLPRKRGGKSGRESEKFGAGLRRYVSHALARCHEPER